MTGREGLLDVVAGSPSHISNTNSRAAAVPCRRQLCPSPALTGRARWRERRKAEEGREEGNGEGGV